MKKFKVFYVWAMNAKFYMGLYYAALVFLTALAALVCGATTINVAMLLEMLGLSVVVALLQVWLVDGYVERAKHLLFPRAVIWIVLSSVLTALCGFFLGWGAGIAFWWPWALGGIMLFGCTAMLLGLRFEQESDSIQLNDSLKQFQASER